jgi:hypothetical protein
VANNTEAEPYRAELIIYSVYHMHGFAGIGGRGIKNRNKLMIKINKIINY